VSRKIYSIYRSLANEFVQKVNGPSFHMYSTLVNYYCSIGVNYVRVHSKFIFLERKMTLACQSRAITRKFSLFYVIQFYFKQFWKEKYTLCKLQFKLSCVLYVVIIFFFNRSIYNCFITSIVSIRETPEIPISKTPCYRYLLYYLLMCYRKTNEIKSWWF
jgi:hypothetical protein